MKFLTFQHLQLLKSYNTRTIILPLYISEDFTWYISLASAFEVYLLWQKNGAFERGVVLVLVCLVLIVREKQTVDRIKWVMLFLIDTVLLYIEFPIIVMMHVFVSYFSHHKVLNYSHSHVLISDITVNRNQIPLIQPQFNPCPIALTIEVENESLNAAYPTLQTKISLLLGILAWKMQVIKMRLFVQWLCLGLWLGCIETRK